jgi:adenosylcobinamide-phosphate synthase
MFGGRLAILLSALLADRFMPEPDELWEKVPHPVVVFGSLIAWLDRILNRPGDDPGARRAMGMVAIGISVAVALAIGSAFGSLFAALSIIGFILELIVVTILLAQRSLADHVSAVAHGLRDGGLAGGRKAVSMIVGRDPATLDEAGVSRAAVESLAENASDGVVAPAFWYAILGLPGLLAYKMLNTADSMIGHRNQTYLDFGRASARLDDFANWVPARLTGALIVAAAYLQKGLDAAGRVWAVMRRDAGLHRSPNAGWPESAMAAALGISLGGPRIYAGDIADEPFMNDDGRKDAGPDDIDAALGVFWRAMTVLVVAVGLAAWGLSAA